MRSLDSSWSRVLAALLVPMALLVLGSGNVAAQGGVKNTVILQPTTPGTVQPGHANISGTVRAGQFVGAGGGLTGIPWGSITGAPTSFPPIGSASGDLSGTYPAPTVARIQGRLVSATAPTTGQVLGWNGTTWAPANGGLNLPYVGSASSASAVFNLTNTGSGWGGIFVAPIGVEGRGTTYGVSGLTQSATSSAIYGRSTFATAFAGRFDGRVTVQEFLGVGTASPLERLHVVGNFRLDNGDIRGWGAIEIRPDTDGTGDDIFRVYSSEGNVQFFVDGDSNVGIGTPSAGVDLAISDADTGFNGSSTGLIESYANGFKMMHMDQNEIAIGREGILNRYRLGGIFSGEFITANRGTGTNLYGMDFCTSATPRLSITLAGNVGIGTQAPDAPLRVIGTAKVDTLEIAGAGDVAEKFDVKEHYVPGTLLEIDPNEVGRLRKSSGAYSTLVAGVVSGAKGLRAGVVLAPTEDPDAQPIALSGRVWVLCETDAKSIKPGQLLVASSRPGYAMAGSDKGRLTGAVIGKAMSGMERGKTGLVLVLVNLQ